MCCYAALNWLFNLNLLLLAPTFADQPALDLNVVSGDTSFARAITKACTPVEPIGTRVPPLVVATVDD